MIDVIIVNYFSASKTIETIKLLLREKIAKKLDIWVVDNSASEEERELLTAGTGGRAKMIMNSENVGFGRACNQVYDKTDNEYVLLLNPDAYLLPSALESLQIFLRDNKRAAAAGPTIFWDRACRCYLPASILPSHWDVFLSNDIGGILGALVDSYAMSKRERAMKYWLSRKPQKQKSLSGGSVLLRRAAVNRVGGLFDPQFFLYFEDTDLFVRLRQQGYELYNLPDAKAVHAFNYCAKEETVWKSEHFESSRKKFINKHHRKSKFRDYLYKGASFFGRKPYNPDITDLGLLNEPPDFEVPQKWRKRWLLEFSLNSRFIPSAGMFGTGETATYPTEAKEIMTPGRQFVRVGPDRGKCFEPVLWTWTYNGNQDF